MSWNNLIPAELLTGGVWEATSVDQTPAIVLVRWSVRQVENGDRHFVGWNATEGEGRVSSRIVDYDPETMTGTTRSGRKYQLGGLAARDPDAEYVWGRWKAINSVEEWTDVSEEFDPVSLLEKSLQEQWLAEGRKPEDFPRAGIVDEDDIQWAYTVLKSKFNKVPHCHAGKDGECEWEKCPQLRDNEPHATHRHCPLDLFPEERDGM